MKDKYIINTYANNNYNGRKVLTRYKFNAEYKLVDAERHKYRNDDVDDREE